MICALGSPRPLIRGICSAISLYLAVWLAGCAGAPPRPEGDKLTQLQVRMYPAPMKTVFDAAVDAAQDLDFMVEQANADAGVVVGTRQTSRQLARITRADDHGLPTWAWVALIATGVIIIAAAVIILSSHDDEKDKDKSKGDEKSKDHRDRQTDDGRGTTSKSSQGGKVVLNDHRIVRQDTVRVKYKEKRRDEPVYRHRERRGDEGYAYWGFDEPEADFIVISDNSPQGKEWHQYRITLHFDNPDTNRTKIRLSVQGARLVGQQVKEAGPVYDPKFYEMFFSSLERSLKLLMPDSTRR